MTRRRPAAAGPIPGRSVPPGHTWGVLSEGPLPANRRPAVPTRVHQSGGQPIHAAPARHADYRARPPPANRPSVDHHKHHGRGAHAGALTLTAVPTSEGGLVVEVAAAFGLPLPALAAVAGGAFAGPFDLGGGELEAGPDLIGLDLGHRSLLALGGLPGPLAKPPGDHDPVTLGQGVGQVLGLAAPDIDLEKRGLAVTPLTILLDALGHGDPQVGDRDAGVGEAQLGGVDQVAGDGGLVVCSHHGSFVLLLVVGLA